MLFECSENGNDVVVDLCVWCEFCVFSDVYGDVVWCDFDVIVFDGGGMVLWLNLFVGVN